MKDFNVTIYETRAITFAVEAEDDIEAGRLLEKNINNYEVLEEEIVDWNVEFVDEV
jgi:hypothetical protein